MTSRTRFLSKLIGLFSVIVAVTMASHRQATLDAVSGILHSSSMLLILGIFTMAVGLAMVLGHNVWSGGVVTVLVTIIGWLSLAKGVVLLLLSPQAEAGLILNIFRYEQLFYAYMAVLFFIGLFLAYSGASSNRSGNVPVVMERHSSAR